MFSILADVFGTATLQNTRSCGHTGCQPVVSHQNELPNHEARKRKELRHQLAHAKRFKNW